MTDGDVLVAKDSGVYDITHYVGDDCDPPHPATDEEDGWLSEGDRERIAFKRSEAGVAAAISDASQNGRCLLREGDEERLAPIVHQVFCVEVMEESHQLVGPWDEDRARAIMERLRDG